MKALALFAVLALAGGPARLAPESAATAVDREDSATVVARMETRVRAADYDGAIEIGEERTRVFPRDAAAWRALGAAYGGKAREAPLLTRLRWAKRCRAAFQRAVDLAPDDIEARTALFLYDMEAPAIVGGSIARARAEADAIGRLDPARGHSALGALYAHEKNFAEAEAEYRHALASDPKSGDARAGLGTVFLEQGRFGEARGLWNDLAGNADFAAVAHYQLGKIALLSGTDLDGAVEHFRAYLANRPAPEAPTWADADWHLALVYERLGKKEDAIGALRDALKIDPDHGPAKKDLKRLLR
jgi:tetratricopeptide (TPR) repeat protein